MKREESLFEVRHAHHSFYARLTAWRWMADRQGTPLHQLARDGNVCLHCSIGALDQSGHVYRIECQLH